MLKPLPFVHFPIECSLGIVLFLQISARRSAILTGGRGVVRGSHTSHSLFLSLAKIDQEVPKLESDRTPLKLRGFTWFHYILLQPENVTIILQGSTAFYCRIL